MRARSQKCRIVECMFYKRLAYDTDYAAVNFLGRSAKVAERAIYF